jgi:Zn-dependent peptidase ImmA (M78 family)
MQPTPTKHRAAAASERGVLAMLRALVPQRRLSPSEALRIAELQANRLLQHFEIDTAPVPDEIVTELPRIRVVRESGLPVSGSAYWSGHYWIITVNADEHPLRQRFSVMHEFKHVLDDPFTRFMYHERSYQKAYERAERTADYFAACLLMSKRIVKSLWFEGPRRPAVLAERLQVSPVAIRYRLDQLGLIDRPSRCEGPRGSWPPGDYRMERILSNLQRATGGRQ